MTAKPKRIVNETLLEEVRRLPCLACTQANPVEALTAAHEGFDCQSHAHHVKSRGAGGDDVYTNVMPLCAKHHAEWHQVGRSKMEEKYTIIATWLECAEEEKTDETN